MKIYDFKPPALVEDFMLRKMGITRESRKRFGQKSLTIILLIIVISAYFYKFALHLLLFVAFNEIWRYVLRPMIWGETQCSLCRREYILPHMSQSMFRGKPICRTCLARVGHTEECFNRIDESLRITFEMLALDRRGRSSRVVKEMKSRKATGLPDDETQHGPFAP